MTNERILGHLENLRQKPEHVRHQIALATAFGVTGLVAVTWMTAMATSGAFALKPGALAQGEPDAVSSDVSKALGESSSAFSNLMGAAGAAFGATSTEAALSIIESETRTSSTFDAKASQDASGKTVIPF